MRQKNDKVSNLLNNEAAAFFKGLWKDKVIISLFCFFCTSAAISYSLLAQEWWTSKAIITKADNQHVLILKNEISNLYDVLNLVDSDGNNLLGNGDSKNLDKFIEGKVILRRFINEYNAFYNKKFFIENDPYFLSLANGNNITSRESKIRFVDSWSSRINIELIGDKNKADTFQLSFQAMEPSLSFELLDRYVAMIKKKTYYSLIERIQLTIEKNEKTLESRLKSQLESAKSILENEKLKTIYALDIATAAKAETPILQMDDQQMFSISLGSKGLAEKIKVLNGIKDLNLINPEIKNTKIQLALLSEIKLSKTMVVEPVKFLKNIDYPVSRDKPKRTFIVLLGLIIGLTIGIFISILKSIIKDNN